MDMIAASSGNAQPPFPGARSTRRCACCRRRSAAPCSKSTTSAARSTMSPTAGAIARRDWTSSSGGDRMIDALFAGTPPSALSGLLREPSATFDLQREDFLAIIDGMEMDVPADIRAPGQRNARSLLRSRGKCGGSPVGSCIRHARSRMAQRSPSIWVERFSSPTFCAIWTRTPARDGSTCRAKRCSLRESTRPTRRLVLDAPGVSRACATLVDLARDALR